MLGDPSPAEGSANAARLACSKYPWAGLRQGIVLGLVLVLGGGLLFGPGLLAERLRLLTAGVCGLQSTHLLNLGPAPLPLCARDTGRFVALLIGYGFFFRRDEAYRWPNLPLIMAAVVFTAAMAVDGFNALLFDLGLPYLYPPDNLLRLATGLLAGLAMAVFIAPATGYFLRWPASPLPRRPLASLVGPLLLLALFLLLAAAGLSVLWLPAALLGVAGVLATAVFVNRWALSIFFPGRGHERFLFALSLLASLVELPLLATLRFAIMPII